MFVELSSEAELGILSSTFQQIWILDVYFLMEIQLNKLVQGDSALNSDAFKRPITLCCCWQATGKWEAEAYLAKILLRTTLIYYTHKNNLPVATVAHERVVGYEMRGRLWQWHHAWDDANSERAQKW